MQAIHNIIRSLTCAMTYRMAKDNQGVDLDQNPDLDEYFSTIDGRDYTYRQFNDLLQQQIQESDGFDLAFHQPPARQPTAQIFNLNQEGK